MRAKFRWVSDTTDTCLTETLYVVNPSHFGKKKTNFNIYLKVERYCRSENIVALSGSAAISGLKIPLSLSCLAPKYIFRENN